jgi:hypothetical protein
MGVGLGIAVLVGVGLGVAVLAGVGVLMGFPASAGETASAMTRHNPRNIRKAGNIRLISFAISLDEG